MSVVIFKTEKMKFGIMETWSVKMVTQGDSYVFSTENEAFAILYCCGKYSKMIQNNVYTTMEEYEPFTFIDVRLVLTVEAAKSLH